MSTTPPVPLTPPPPPQPIQQQDQNQQAPVQSSPVNGPSPELAHSALIGHGFKSLVNSMAGSSTQYVQTPGGPQPVEVPNKPGQFFRNILAGAIMGGVAGGQGPNEAGSGWGAAARGAGAAQQGFQQQQQARQQQAQQQFQNQQSANKETRENTLMNATIAQYQSEMAARQHMTDLEDKKYHDTHNTASAALYSTLKDVGGVAPVDAKLPEDLTAYDLAKAYTKDPTIRQAPTGYVRHFIDKTDSDEVTWNGEHWTHPDGTPADMTDKTSIQVLDVPVDAMKTRIKGLSNDTVNKVLGQNILPAGGTTDSIAPLDLVNMAGTRLNREKEIAQTKHEGMVANAQARAAQNEAERLKRDGYNAAREQVVQENTTLEDQLKNTLDPTANAPIQQKIDANNARLRQLYEQNFPSEKLPAQTTIPPAKIAHPEVVSILTTEIPGFDPGMAQKIGNLSPDQISDQLKTSKLPLATKNKILASVGKPPMKEDQVTLPGIIKGAANTAKENLGKLETFFTGNQ